MANRDEEKSSSSTQSTIDEDRVWLKQHRKASLELRGGRKLVGQLKVSLKNAGDRQVLLEFIKELRKQWRDAEERAHN